MGLVLLYILDAVLGYVYDAPLYGSIETYAYYFTDLMVGTPPQRQSVIIDTGSTLLGFPCTTCGANCGQHMDDPFSPENSISSTRINCGDLACKLENARCEFRGAQCRYSQAYAEGSTIRGHYYSDIISLDTFPNRTGTAINPTVRYDYIGCHDRETVLFKSQGANGIMGISFPREGVQPTPIDALLSDPNLDSKIFTLCHASDGGLMTIGGYKPELLLEGQEMQWHNITSSSAYNIKLDSISGTVPGKNSIVTGQFYNALIDSGTTYTYFPRDVYEAIKALFREICDYVNDTAIAKCASDATDLMCFDLSEPRAAGQSIEQVLHSIPPLVFQFSQHHKLSWFARNYLYNSHGDVWCTAVDSQIKKQTILGQSFLKNVQVSFDRMNKRIGLGNSNCPVLAVRKSNYTDSTDGDPKLRSSQWNRINEYPADLANSQYVVVMLMSGAFFSVGLLGLILRQRRYDQVIALE